MNSCNGYELYGPIVYYSHLIPVVITIFAGIFVLLKSKYSHLSKVFFLFTFTFSLWMLGDVVAWTSQDYHLISFVWAPLDYINILFYLSAAYFFAVIVRDKDIPDWAKIVLFGISIPAWWITASGQSITDFYQPWCEATNNDTLTSNKFAIEIVVLAFIMIYGFYAAIRSEVAKRKQIIVVGSALVLFLTVFAFTEYIASATGLYEINLYSLFILPLFLGLIIYSITNLNIFAYKSFGTQLLIYVLLIMVGSQFFLIHDATFKTLTAVTFVIAAFLSIVLARNIQKEEILALELQAANEGQSNLMHILNHQIKGYLSKSRNIFSELITEPSYNACTAEAHPLLDEGYKSLTEGVEFVTEFLHASNIDKGSYTYQVEKLDFKSLVSDVANEQKKAADDKGLSFEVNLSDGDYNMNGDNIQLKQAVKNLIDNSIKYTPAGSIKINLSRGEKTILFIVNDTGVGLSDEVKPKLFTKGGRDKDSMRININSTGFGLAFVKSVANAHKGRVWAESPGSGKGSTFSLELPVA